MVGGVAPYLCNDRSSNDCRTRTDPHPCMDDNTGLDANSILNPNSRTVEERATTVVIIHVRGAFLTANGHPRSNDTPGSNGDDGGILNEAFGTNVRATSDLDVVAVFAPEWRFNFSTFSKTSQGGLQELPAVLD